MLSILADINGGLVMPIIWSSLIFLALAGVIFWLVRNPPRTVLTRRHYLRTLTLCVFALIILTVVLARIWRGKADWVRQFDDWLLSNQVYGNIFWTVFAVSTIGMLAHLVEKAMTSRCEKLEDRHRIRRGIAWTRITLLIVVVGVVWFRGVELGIFLGVVGAGLALSMQEVILSAAGWLLIIVKRPFDIGDRIEMDNLIGDVIDIRLFQTTVLEVGNWVDADQSTGRMINIPNSAVFRKFIANYTKGFPFIWNEISITVTFESDWERARDLILEKAVSEAGKIEEEVQRRIEQMQRHYAIRYEHLSPIVYTKIADSGIVLTLRYICPARKRRATTNTFTEAILGIIEKENKINLAYPTTRFYDATRE